MRPTHTKTLLRLTALATLFGTLGYADISLPLKPGYAVHTMGVSPDADTGDENRTVRIYDTTGQGYDSSRPTADFNDTSYSDPLWNIDTIGNVYGIAIDPKKNIYVTASANWSPGYVDRGDANHKNVPVKYGSIGGGENNISAGTIYKLDAKTGQPTVFAQLPQNPAVDIVNQVCQGTGDDIPRHGVGAGLGNIAYDKFHDQYFVSNFSDGKIYRLNNNGKKLDNYPTEFKGINVDGKTVRSPYGLAVSPDGSKLFFGTMETNYKPQLFSIDLKSDGSFGTHIEDQEAKLTDGIVYSQNIGGGAYDGSGIWAAYSDLTFTPDGDLLVGVRVGCKGNFATSYNHGGVVYLLQKGDGGHYNQAAKKTSGGTTNYNEVPDGNASAEDRAGISGTFNHYAFNRDDGAIPLHPNESDADQAKLNYGPDDGYGGVAVWQDRNGSYDLYATSSDITMGEGVHGFMQFSGDFTITDTETLDKVIGYKAVASSVDKDAGVNNSNIHDYKGIGGDVEVLSVVPVSIGSYVWEDTNKDGIQGSDEPGICGVKLKLTDKEGNPVKDIDDKNVSDTTTAGEDCTYTFDNLPEGDYRVCVVSVPISSDGKFVYTKTPVQTAADNNDTLDDSNFADENCSGVFTLVANSEPIENGSNKGDDQDDAHDNWGNMTVDFGFVKNVFDLALVKKLVGDEKRKAGEKVTFTITVTNQGNVDATDVEISDYIPEGLTLADSTWTKSADGETASKNIGGVAANQSKDVNITFTIDDDYQGVQIVNRAEITKATNDLNLSDADSTPGNQACQAEAPDGDADNSVDAGASNGCDDIDPAKIIIEQHFDLALIKKVQADQGTKFKRGDKVTFTITVINQGTVTGKNIQVQDDIPEGLELADENWSLSGDKAILKTPIASLLPGKNVTKTIAFKIKENFKGGKIINIAEIQSAKNDLNLTDDDSTPGDNPCTTEHEIDNNDDLSDTNQCDDVDPAWITLGNPTAVDGASDSKSDSSSAGETCDCAGVQGNKVDAMSTWMMILMVFSIVMIGFLQSRERVVK